MPSSYNYDRLRQDGAQLLANAIMRYWRKHGETVRAWIEPINDSVVVARLNALAKRPDDELYVVRSDLVNGLPRKKAMAKAA